MWVPYELGRPIGVPNDPEFQKNVIKAAFDLLDAESGPVLVDYPVEIPEDAAALDEDAMTVTDPTGKRWRVFDALRVKIEVEELPARRSRLAVRVVRDA